MEKHLLTVAMSCMLAIPVVTETITIFYHMDSGVILGSVDSANAVRFVSAAGDHFSVSYGWVGK